MTALAAVSVLVLGACDDGDDSDASTDTTESAGDDAGDGGAGGDGAPSGGECALVTEDEAEAVIGEPVEFFDNEVRPPEVSEECIWQASSPSSAIVLQTRVWDSPAFYTPDLFEDQGGVERIDGVGDGAYRLLAGLGVELTVLAGERTVTISLTGTGEELGSVDDPSPEVVREVVELARTVVARL